MEAPGPSPTEIAACELLAEACVIISSFRNRLSNACYPFPEPPRAAALISEIDALLNPPAPSGRPRESKPVSIKIPTAADIRRAAKHDTSCVGAFARAKPNR